MVSIFFVLGYLGIVTLIYGFYFRDLAFKIKIIPSIDRTSVITLSILGLS